MHLLLLMGVNLMRSLQQARARQLIVLAATADGCLDKQGEPSCRTT
jgi:hypothetical protein